MGKLSATSTHFTAKVIIYSNKLDIFIYVISLPRQLCNLPQAEIHNNKSKTLDEFKRYTQRMVWARMHAWVAEQRKQENCDAERRDLLLFFLSFLSFFFGQVKVDYTNLTVYWLQQYWWSWQHRSFRHYTTYTYTTQCRCAFWIFFPLKYWWWRCERKFDFEWHFMQTKSTE